MDASSYDKAIPRSVLLRRMTRHFPEIDPVALEVVTALKAVAQGFTDLLLQPLMDEGLSEGKFCVLLLLWLVEQEDPTLCLGPSEIADQIGVTRATVTGLLDGLERDSFITRQHEARDRRTLSVELMEKGRRLLTELLPEKMLVINRITEALTPAETKTLISLLAKIEAQTGDAG